MVANEQVTIGEVCLQLRVLEGQIRRMCNRGDIPFSRLGRTRVFRTADFPKIRAACVKAGYLKPEVNAAI